MGWYERLFGTNEEEGPAINSGNTPAVQQRAALEDAQDATDIWHLPSVVAARGLMADTAAVLPMVAVNEDTGQPAERHRLLRRPDPSEPYFRTIERMVNQMTRHGGTLLEISDTSVATGWPLAVRVVHHSRYWISVDPSNMSVIEATIDGRDADPARFRYVPFVLDDGPVGQSPFEQVRGTLEQALAVMRYATGYYGNPMQPFALTSDLRLTPNQTRTLSEQWMLSRGERVPPVFSGKLTPHALPVPSAVDAALLEAADRLDAHVARITRIPPSLLNTYSHGSLTYSTTSQEFHRWLLIGLYPLILARIEAAFTDLLPRGVAAVFDTFNLTRPDLAGEQLSSADDTTPRPAQPVETT